jgi:hypothetical protein
MTLGLGLVLIMSLSAVQARNFISATIVHDRTLQARQNHVELQHQEAAQDKSCAAS